MIRTLTQVSLLAALGLAATPAMATSTPLPVAEPGSLTLLAVGAVAGALVYRLRKRP